MICTISELILSKTEKVSSVQLLTDFLIRRILRVDRSVDKIGIRLKYFLILKKRTYFKNTLKGW